jgi:hypothetical protein
LVVEGLGVGVAAGLDPEIGISESLGQDAAAGK